MSFATLEDMANRRKVPITERVGMMGDSRTPLGPPPEYNADREDTLNPRGWDMRYWSWKKWAGLIVGVVIVVVIAVIVAVEVTKKSKYPDYSTLAYSLADTCKYPLF